MFIVVVQLHYQYSVQNSKSSEVSRFNFFTSIFIHISSQMPTAKARYSQFCTIPCRLLFYFTKCLNYHIDRCKDSWLIIFQSSPHSVQNMSRLSNLSLLLHGFLSSYTGTPSSLHKAMHFVKMIFPLYFLINNVTSINSRHLAFLLIEK